ncbi:SSI family serine proteinase inhibitor [Actinoplanes sp. NPDC051513]|uniref:SSI family serine proteinase inhibitor n=1 Tax=Actinoplanes sp. NPDC051513 TaxID=3363908 RepID=UPI00378BF568
MIRTMMGLAAAATVILTAGPATAATPDPGYAGGGRVKPGASLTMKYAGDAGPAKSVELECDPPGGSHPKAAEACAALAAAGGNPFAIEPAHHACFLVYSPVTVEVSGTWHGRHIDWQFSYGNSCEMERALGVIVDF